MSFRRKSATGWNFYGVFLDLSGGLLRALQLLLDCWTQADWSKVSGEHVKLLFGFSSRAVLANGDPELDLRGAATEFGVVPDELYLTFEAEPGLGNRSWRCGRRDPGVHGDSVVNGPRGVK